MATILKKWDTTNVPEGYADWWLGPTDGATAKDLPANERLQAIFQARCPNAGEMIIDRGDHHYRVVYLPSATPRAARDAFVAGVEEEISRTSA